MKIEISRLYYSFLFICVVFFVKKMATKQMLRIITTGDESMNDEESKFYGNSNDEKSLDNCSLQQIFDHYDFSFTFIRNNLFFDTKIDYNNDDNDDGKINFNILLNKFFNKIKSMHGSLAKKFQMIDHDVKQVIANVKRMNEKNDIKAIQFYNCSIREKDYHTKLSYINQVWMFYIFQKFHFISFRFFLGNDLWIKQQQ